MHRTLIMIFCDLFMKEGTIWTFGWVVFVKEEEHFQIGGSREIYFGPPLQRGQLIHLYSYNIDISYLITSHVYQ